MRMKHLNDEELEAQIETFLARKSRQYPELSLRGKEKRAESIGYVVMDSLSELVARRKIVKIV